MFLLRLFLAAPDENDINPEATVGTLNRPMRLLSHLSCRSYYYRLIPIWLPSAILRN